MKGRGGRTRALPAPSVRFEPEFLARVERLLVRLAGARERREGSGRSFLLGGGEEFSGHRPYRPGEDLRALPLVERKSRLRALVPDEDPRLLYVDHVEEHTIRGVLEAGFWAGMTLYPTTKCTPERAVDMVEIYGPERLLVDSSSDWGPSRPSSVPDFIFAMRRRGHEESLIRRIVYENPLEFWRQSKNFDWDEV